MSEGASHRDLVAVNYHAILMLHQYSLSKLNKNRDWLLELVLCDVPILEHSQQLADRLELQENEIQEKYQLAAKQLSDSGSTFRVVTLIDEDYPRLLKRIDRPPWILFYRGKYELTNTNCVSVVGSRAASDAGIKRARRLSRLLIESGCTVVSGLAKGIDTAAQAKAIEMGGATIGVIGTPIDQAYPRENRTLQQRIASEHLLVSQFPIGQPVQRYNFPVRNQTMCGLSKATVIVEASETSGALHQARACIKEGRKLFIMKSLFERPNLKWPKNFADQGAIILGTPEQLTEEISSMFSNSHSEPGDEDLQQLQLFG